MSMVDLWTASPDQLSTKHVQQIISFAGTGKLTDGKGISPEFRQLLAHIPAEFLERYAGECLIDKFDGSGLALQDIVNEVGRRLDFDVIFGRYRGVTGQNGFDGLWAGGIVIK